MPQIIEGVYFIQGREGMMPDSHAYVVGKPDSHDLSLIDPGLMGNGSFKLESIRSMGIEPEAIKRIIMTHTHFDHIGCLAEIKEMIPRAELWVHTMEAGPLEIGDERTVYGMGMFQSMCMLQYKLQPGAFTFTVDRKLEGGETLDIGGMIWEVVHVPGHSPGSIGLYNRSEKVLIPGDVVYADHAIGRFDLHGANGSEHKDSLLRLAELEVAVLLPGHNRIVTDLPPGYISETAQQWAPLLV